MKEKKPKTKLPALSKVKKALYADWALRVKQRDGWKCLLCGSENKPTTHHWCVSDHHAHAARYSVANGATLCYACHIRRVHSRADFVSVDAVRRAVLAKTNTWDLERIGEVAKIEVTTDFLRSLWNAMRNRPIIFRREDIVVNVGAAFPKPEKKFPVVHLSKVPVAVVGNTVLARLSEREEMRAEVLSVDRDIETHGGIRYMLKILPEEA